MIHGYLIGCLVVMPFCQSVRAEGEGEFVQTSTESYVEIGLSTSEGTSNFGPSDTRTVTATIQTHSWEVWTHSGTGAVETMNDSWTPVSGAWLNQYVDHDSGMAYLGQAATDSSGQCSFSVSGSNNQTLVKVIAATSEEASLAFEPPMVVEEQWSFSHYEGLVSASLSSDGQSVGSGQSQTLTASVTYNQWEVQMSSWGNTRTVNFSSSPASGAQVSWSVESGDGSVTAYNWSTDGSGNATAGFTMGSTSSRVRVDVSYAGGSSTSASIDLTPAYEPPQWWYSHSEYGPPYVTNVGVDGDTHNLPAGTVRVVTGQWMQDSWEVHTDGVGTEQRNWTSSPVSYGSLYAVVTDGQGSTQSTNSISADYSGNFSYSFTMGTVPVSLTLSQTGDPASATYSVAFSPMPWNYSHTETGSNVSLVKLGDGSGSASLIPSAQLPLVATVTAWSREVWTDAQGNVEYRNQSSVPAPNTALSLSVPNGDGSLDQSAVMTDANGQASCTFTMGSGDSVVRATSGTGSNPEDPYADFSISLEPETFQYVRTESTVAVALTSDGTTTGLTSGATREVTGKVTYSSWEVWQSNYGNTDDRNRSSGVAINAGVSFTINTGGDGTITPGQSSTNDNGDAKATFTMGSQVSVVRMDVNYAGTTAVGTLTLTPEVLWVKTGNSSSVTSSLTESDGNLTVSVTYQTWEVWSNGTETRFENETNGYAANAAVNFSFSQGNGSFTTASGYTDGQGNFSTTYSVTGTAPWTISMSGDFSSKSTSAQITINSPPSAALSISTTGLASGVQDQEYSSSVAATGGTAPYTWSATGLPGGLAIDSSSGAISGTPSGYGDFSVSVTVTDSASRSDTKSFTITITENEEDDDDDTCTGA